MTTAAATTNALDLAAFEAMKPGQTLVLSLDHEPGPLLARAQTELKGLFDWSPLEEGPRVWRVEVARRDASRGSLRRVTEALSWDHDRLEALDARAFDARSAGDHRTASEVFAVFAHGLRRHIRFEEELLFPEFEARAGFPPDAGPTAVMRAEHREILALLDEIGHAIGDAAAPAEQSRIALHEVLGGHNLKEEQVLYPGVDRLMTEAESDDLVARIQALRG